MSMTRGQLRLQRSEVNRALRAEIAFLRAYLRALRASSDEQVVAFAAEEAASVDVAAHRRSGLRERVFGRQEAADIWLTRYRSAAANLAVRVRERERARVARTLLELGYQADNLRGVFAVLLEAAHHGEIDAWLASLDRAPVGSSREELET